MTIVICIRDRSLFIAGGGVAHFFPTTFLEIAVYFANKCEAMFSTGRLKIFKCLLETNLASSVKPGNYSRILEIAKWTKIIQFSQFLD